MAQKPTFDYDIIVIGSGAGGSPAASIAARQGKRVALIEQDEFGGESPNWGEIPLSALLNAAHLYDEAKKAAAFGLRTSTVGYNYPSLLSWRDTVVKRTGAAGNRHYYEKQGISVFHGTAHFLSPNEISVNRRHLSARKFIIATGAEWEIPAIAGLEEAPYHTPKTILSLTRPPKSLFVIGGGSTAAEIACLLATFGTKVYLSDPASRILPEHDADVATLLSEQFKTQRGMTILAKTKVVAVHKDGLYKRVTYARGGREQTVKVDEVLIAGQRTPITDLGLENAGVKYTATGITVNEYLQTSVRHIFAAGACIHPTATTQEILMHSRVAAHNALKRTVVAVEPHLPLHITRTLPQVARVGLSEDDCLRRDLKVRMATAPLTLVPRSNVTDERLGFVKLIANSKGVILGATIVANQADTMIHELALAVRHQLTARDLFTTLHDFMSWSDAIRVAASKLL